MRKKSCCKNTVNWEVLQDIDYYETQSTQCEPVSLKKCSDKTKLDLFLPKGDAKWLSKSAVVVFVPGGSWRRGDRRAYRHYLSVFDTNLLVATVMAFYDLYWNVGRAFAKNGVACAVISYRLTRLKLPWVLLELLSSLVMSVTFVMFFFFLSVVAVALVISALMEGQLTFQDLLSSETFSLSVLFSLCCIWIIKCYDSNIHYKFISKVVLFFLPFAISCLICVIVNLTFETFLSCLTVILILLLMLPLGAILNYNTRVVSHPNHLWDVAHSVKWVKMFGDDTKRFDAKKLFLCGHSAGGHLVSLLALDIQYLEALRMHGSDIKGVITISGVYNLHRLATGIMKHLFLSPVFGDQPDKWSKASPLHCLIEYNKSSLRDQSGKPPFLVLDAECLDFHLVEDADDFVRELKHLNIECVHFVIGGTNHFSAITKFDSGQLLYFNNTQVSRGGFCSIDELCVAFIRKFS